MRYFEVAVAFGCEAESQIMAELFLRQVSAFYKAKGTREYLWALGGVARDDLPGRMMKAVFSTLFVISLWTICSSVRND